MIEKIAKIQNIATRNDSTIHLNTSLPISILVSEKIGFNRYILRFANRQINTRSTKNLKVGAKYWGEIENNKDNIIIKGLCEKPNLDSFILKDGLLLIEKFINEPDTKWFSEYLKQSLLISSTKDEFEGFSNMLLALSANIIHIPFVYNETSGVFQFKKQSQISEIYLVFSNFAPIMFTIDKGKIINLKSPFQKVLSLLQDEFKAKCELSQTEPLWIKNINLIDQKG